MYYNMTDERSLSHHVNQVTNVLQRILGVRIKSITVCFRSSVA